MTDNVSNSKESEDDNNSLYESNEEYNQTIDLGCKINDDMVCFGASQFRPSEILYKLDIEGYKEGLLEFKNEKETEFLRQVYDAYPPLIAYPFNRCTQGYENNIQRLNLLKDVWEGIVSTIYSIVMGEILQKSISLKEIVSDKKPLNVFSDSLFVKLLIIERICEMAEKDNLKLIFTKYFPKETITSIRELNTERNIFSHATALSEKQARDKFEELYPKVLTTLKKINNFSELIFVRYFDSTNSRNSIKFEVFQGHSDTKKFKIIEIKSDNLNVINEELNNEYIFICLDFKTEPFLICTSPFVHYIEVESGHRTNLCFLKKRRNHALEYGSSCLGTMIHSIDGSNLSSVNKILSLVNSNSEVSK